MSIVRVFSITHHNRRNPMRTYLDFEKPVAELEAKAEELRAMGETDNAVVGHRRDISRLEVQSRPWRCKRALCRP